MTSCYDDNNVISRDSINKTKGICPKDTDLECMVLTLSRSHGYRCLLAETGYQVNCYNEQTRGYSHGMLEFIPTSQ